MKPASKALTTLLFLSLALTTQGQKERNWSLNGYVKYMETNFITGDSAIPIFSDHLVHNRMNFKWYPNEHLTVKLELRNRAFYGEYTKLIPNYGEMIGKDNGIVDLSFNIIDHNAFVLNSTIDRAYVAWDKGKWNIRLGRQRINWGINTIWTPNDIFNALNFFDFDYEERPGVDAFRAQYYRTAMSSLDFAIAPAQDPDNWIGAFRYATNYKNYDWQFLVGNYQEDISAGIGWAGNIKTAGFKGEITQFLSRTSNDSANSTIATMAFDYSFNKGWYVMGGFLYNSPGTDGSLGATGATNLFSSDISVKNLMPTRYTLMLMTSKSLNPATSFSLSSMFAPGSNFLIVFPTITYSIKTNWNIDLVAQSSFLEQAANFTHGGSAVFLRLKWSY